MFSARLPPLEPNRISHALDLVRRQGTQLLDLTESNPTAVGLAYPPGILGALSDARGLDYRPSPRGLPEARHAVANYYARRGEEIDAERVWLTASTSESYSFLFKLLCNPGEKILVPRPSYPLFEHLAALDGVRAETYSLRYHAGWYLDLADVREKIDRDTRAILLVNPNNPTGTFLKQNELVALKDLCRGRDIALISDEVFADYHWGIDTLRVPSLAITEDVLTFVLSGLSKPAGLPQVKLGWIYATGPERLLSQVEPRLDLIADTYLSVSTAVQWAAPRLFDLVVEVGGQISARVRANRAQLKNLVRDSAVQLLDGEGDWSAVLRLPRTRTEEEWVLLFLERDSLLVHPGFFFDMEDEAYLVVSLLSPEADLAEGARRIVQRVGAP